MYSLLVYLFPCDLVFELTLISFSQVYKHLLPILTQNLPGDHHQWFYTNQQYDANAEEGSYGCQSGP